MTSIEFSLERYSKRGMSMPRQALWSPAWLQKVEKVQAHHSVYAFDEDELEVYLAEHGAMSGEYPGVFHLEELVLDFDGKEEELPSTYREMKHYVRHLTRDMHVPRNAIKVWFSGRKGFHITLDGRLFSIKPSVDVPYQVKEMVQRHLHHTLLDMAPLSPAGLIRAPWSWHPQGECNKVLVPLEALLEEMPLDIRLPDLSDRRHYTRPTDDEVSPVLAHLMGLPKPRQRFTFETGAISKHDPTRMVTCMQKLLARGPRQGSRHQEGLRLASWLWRSGIPKDAAGAVMSQWLEPSEGVRLVAQVYAKGYTYGCSDPVMAAFCDDKCMFNTRKDFAMDVPGYRQLSERLENYVKLLDEGRGFDLYDLYRVEGKKGYRILPGQVCVVIADTGIGKTLFVQDILRRLEKRTLYLNLEMQEDLVTRRFLQSFYNMTNEEVMTAVRRGEALRMIEGGLPWLRMISDAPTPELVERAVEQLRPEILVVDTTDGLMVPGQAAGSNTHLRAIVEAMRHIAHGHDPVVFLIHHINKSGARALSGEGMEKKRSLSINDGTGDRSYAQKSDHVLGIEGHPSEGFRRLRSLKVRDGAPLDMDLEFDFLRMRVHTWTPPSNNQLEIPL